MYCCKGSRGFLLFQYHTQLLFCPAPPMSSLTLGQTPLWRFSPDSPAEEKACCAAVGEFRKLALLAEADGHLRQKLQQVLKLSKEKWDDARDHAMRAVVADNRMRIWYADKASMELGLLFTCRLGNVDLDRPVGESLYLHAPIPCACHLLTSREPCQSLLCVE